MNDMDVDDDCGDVGPVETKSGTLESDQYDVCSDATPFPDRPLWRNKYCELLNDNFTVFVMFTD